MPPGKRVTLIVWLIGVSMLIGLTVWYGANEVGQAIIGAGWATALVVLVRLTGVTGAGIGWWLLFPKALRPSALLCVLVRLIRESTNALLPLAQVGGDFIGARCLTLQGTKGTIAAASVIVDILIQAATQLLFAMIGLMLLMLVGGNNHVIVPVATGIAMAIPALAAFYLAQSELGYRLFKRILKWIVGEREWSAFGTVDDLFAQLSTFYSSHAALARSFLWHFADWFVGTAEVWIVLSFMGYPVTVMEAVIIESLLHAVRGAAFMVPGALGAQEGGLIVLCAIFNIPPEAALALSLVKRIPDIIIGVPGLIAWQAMEGWHFSGGRSRPASKHNERA
jgi:putative membrane protein